MNRNPARALLLTAVVLTGVLAPAVAGADAVFVERSKIGLMVTETTPADSTAPASHAPDLPLATVHAWQTGLLRADRLEHASLSFTLASCAGLAGGGRTSAFGSAFAFGLAKELHDGRSGRFDRVDLAADLLGASLGALGAARR